MRLDDEINNIEGFGFTKNNLAYFNKKDDKHPEYRLKNYRAIKHIWYGANQLSEAALYKLLSIMTTPEGGALLAGLDIVKQAGGINLGKQGKGIPQSDFEKHSLETLISKIVSKGIQFYAIREGLKKGYGSFSTKKFALQERIKKLPKETKEEITKSLAKPFNPPQELDKEGCYGLSSPEWSDRNFDGSISLTGIRIYAVDLTKKMQNLQAT